MNTDDLIKAVTGEIPYDEIDDIKFLLQFDIMHLWAQIGIEMILGGEY